MSQNPSTRAIIIAWDDIVARTLASRATALRLALDAEGHPRELTDVMSATAGRAFAEATRTLLSHDQTQNQTQNQTLDQTLDQTLVDLIALRAQRAYSASILDTVSLNPDAVQSIASHAARGTRIILRADSIRRDVDALLGAFDLRDRFAFIRCSDDRPHRPSTSSAQQSYVAIDAKLALLGIAPPQRVAAEPHPVVADIARRYAETVGVGLGASL